MGENQQICDADEEEPVEGHAIDGEAKLDLPRTMEQGKIVYNICRVLCSFIRCYRLICMIYVFNRRPSKGGSKC